MKYYELTYLIDKNLPEEERIKLSEKVIGFLPNPPIKKEDGFSSSTLEFYCQPEKIQEIENNLRAESQIMRFMLLVKKLTKPKRLRASRRRPVEELATPATEVEKKEKKVELKEIEKKLDEILKES